jgi:hypothetical protein
LKKTTAELRRRRRAFAVRNIGIGITGRAGSTLRNWTNHRDYHRGDHRITHGLRRCKNQKLGSMLGNHLG